MIVLRIDKDLSARLERQAVLSGMSAEAYTQELLKQAVEEADDLDLAVEEYRRDGSSKPLEQVERELGLNH